MRQSLQDVLSRSRPPNLSLVELILNDDSCKQLSDYLLKQRNYQVIELKGCNIGPLGFSSICQVRQMRLNFNLKSLLAEWNQIGTRIQGIQSLCEILNTPGSTIQQVDLKNNRLTAEHCQLISQMLKNNSSLLSLNLKWNEIGEKGAQLLFEGLKSNQTLKFLDISCNKVPEEISGKIRGLIDRNRTSDMKEKNQPQPFQQEPQKFQETMKQQQQQPEQPYNISSTVRIKNDQLRAAQLKEQIDEEFRNNRLLKDEMEKRLSGLKEEIQKKEIGVVEQQRRHEELLHDKAVIERQFKDMRKGLEQQQSQYEEKKQKLMNEYLDKNKHTTALENEYNKELNALRGENKKQIQEINNYWQPKVHSQEDFYNLLLKQNEDKNEALLRMKEKFLKMRLDQDEKIKQLQSRFYVEFKNQFQIKEEKIQHTFNEIEQSLKMEQIKNNEICDNLKRLEKNSVGEKKNLEDLIFFERDRIHTSHFDMSKKNIRIAKYINKNLILDGHYEKQVRRIQELNNLLMMQKDATSEDSRDKRQTHEQQYVIFKQSQGILHQRVLDLEMLLRNQEMANSRLKMEYEKLCQGIQNKVTSAIAEVCRTEIANQ